MDKDKETLVISRETVSAYTTLVTKPKENGFEFAPITDCFQKSDQVTASHELFNQYIEYIQKPLPKPMFYIIMIDLFGQPSGKDQKGNAGYHLQFLIPQQ